MMPSPVPIDVVAKHYLGEPFSKSDREWRYGNKGSLSINLDNNVWFDHEADEGGGVVDFIRREEGEKADVSKILLETFSAPERCPISFTPSETTPRIHDYDGFYQKVKSAEGRWTTRHPDGNGGFSPGMGEQQHRLYGQADLEALKLAEQPIFFVEGEKDVDTLRRHNLFAVSSGSTSSWRDDFAHLFAGHDIKIIPDNDAAGHKFAAQVMAALKPVTASVGIISLPDMPEKGDVSDYLTTHCVEEFMALEANAELTTYGRLMVHTLSSLKQLPEPDFLIDGIILENSDVVIYGESEAHKSGTAISMAVAIATGTNWMGRKTKSGPVLFIAGEGGSLLGRRIQANFKYYELEPTDQFRVISDNIDLFAGDADIEELTLIASDIRPSLIIYDTISQHSGSASENSDEMKNVLRHARQISRACDATNIMLAHPGKEVSRGVRGWSGQKNNVDTVLKQERTNDAIILTCEKQKDAAHFKPIGLRFEIIDEAPVIVEGDTSDIGQREKQLTKNQRIAYGALCDVIVGNQRISDIDYCSEAHWREECARVGLGGTERASQRTAFRRAYNSLLQVKFYVDGKNLFVK